MGKSAFLVVLGTLSAVTTWCGEPSADPRRFLVVNSLTGEVLVGEGEKLLLAPSPGKPGVELALQAAEPFIPTQFVGPYIAGSVGGGEGEPGYFTVFTRQGRAVNRCWKDLTTCFSWGEHPQLAADGSAVVAVAPDLERRISIARSCRLPDLVCVSDEVTGLSVGGGSHYALSFRDVLLIVDRTLQRLKDGNVVWQGDRPLNGPAVIADVRGSEVLVVEPMAGAVHVFSLENGKRVFGWEPATDPAEVARVLGAKSWEEAVHRRCRGRETGRQDLLPEPSSTPPGYHPSWTALAAALALSGGAAAFLPEGDILVIGGRKSSGSLECEGPRRVWIISRQSGKTQAATDLGSVAASADAFGTYVRLARGPAGPYVLCGDQGCAVLHLGRLARGTS